MVKLKRKNIARKKYSKNLNNKRIKPVVSLSVL